MTRSDKDVEYVAERSRILSTTAKALDKLKATNLHSIQVKVVKDRGKVRLLAILYEDRDFADN